MDDLAGLDWNAAGQQSMKKPAPLNSTSNYYPTLKPTPPLSGRNTPSPAANPRAPSIVSNIPTPKNDSFAKLLPSSNANQPIKNLSLREQQALLEQQKSQKLLNQSRQWDTLALASTATSASGSRTASPAPFSVQVLNGQSNGLQGLSKPAIPLQNFQTQSQPIRIPSEDIDDILAAFDSDAVVDRSTHFPVPSRPDSRNVASPPTQQKSTIESSGEDDDPFGLGTTSTILKPDAKAAAATSADNEGDDDDVLGLLGKPVSDLPPSRSNSQAARSEGHPVDAAIAELVDMGFAADNARDALATTESGLDVQNAVGYLLNQAHARSRSRNRETSGELNGHKSRQDNEEFTSAQQQRNGSQRRNDSSEAVKDPVKGVSDIGQSFFKTANSLWKAGQKKVNKAMADFNTEADSSQPKWMRDNIHSSEPRPARTPVSNGLEPRSVKDEGFSREEGGLTNEAALLELNERPLPRSKKTQPADHSAARDQRQFVERPRWHDDDENVRQPAKSRDMHQLKVAPVVARAKLTRESNEEVSAYISPARRKKTMPKPEEPEPNLLEDNQSNGKISAKSSKLMPSPQPTQPTRLVASQSRDAKQSAVKPKVKSREVPTISASILQASTTNRSAGTAAFKLGNYAEAHELYTKALRDVPKQHPLTIVLLTNRALTSLKTGDPKQCITDADQAIEIIGPSRGIEESITIGGNEGIKDMAPYWGKAMIRRAEALEQLERWIDAAKVWKDCVEAGVGGAQSVQGRTRCEKASGTGPDIQPVPRRPTPAPKKTIPKTVVRSAMDDITGRPASVTADSSEAVNRLRAANDAAAKLDDERFALTDAVAARIETWRKGKEQNLRALLGSLDTVLWPDSGWKKIGMSELLNPSKVKINYMKGIAKVHPDKLPTTATTEQIMISGAVFSTLNEAWDGFKKENGL